jgi:hypothetical protein
MASIFMARSIIVQCDTKVPGVIGSGRGGSKAGGLRQRSLLERAGRVPHGARVMRRR